MAKSVEMFMCEGCRARYETLTEAQLCEKRHQSFIKEVFAVYDTPQGKSSSLEAPDKIVVTFSNNVKATYRKDVERERLTEREERVKAPRERDF